MEHLWIVLTFLAAAAGTLVAGFLLKWVDRKVTAMVQWRKGPPWYQPIVDVLKLTAKENIVPATARGTGFRMAPVLALAATGVAAAILWMGILRLPWALPGDLIVVVYLLVIPALMTILGAASSGNPHAAVGAGREMKLLLSYELPMFLAILVAVTRASWMLADGWTFRIDGLLAAQESAPVVFSISGVMAIVITILCVQAKLGQVPFDLAEAECEIMSGVYVEYSGPSLAYWLMERAMMLALLPVLVIALFWGGLYVRAWWGILTFIGKYVLLVALVTLIRNTNPRLRIDQTVKLFWFYLAPLAALALVLAFIGKQEQIPWL